MNWFKNLFKQKKKPTFDSKVVVREWNENGMFMQEFDDGHVEGSSSMWMQQLMKDIESGKIKTTPS